MRYTALALLLTLGVVALLRAQQPVPTREFITRHPLVKADFTLRGAYTVPFTDEKGKESAALVIITEVKDTHKSPSVSSLDVQYLHLQDGRMTTFDRERLAMSEVEAMLRKQTTPTYTHRRGQYQFRFSNFPFAASTRESFVVDNPNRFAFEVPGNKTGLPPVRVDSLDVVVSPGWTFEKAGDYMYIRGSVQNKGMRRVRYWQATVNFLDKNNKIIDSGYTNALETLLPGASKRFEIIHPVVSEAERARVYVEKVDFEEETTEE